MFGIKTRLNRWRTAALGRGYGYLFQSRHNPDPAAYGLAAGPHGRLSIAGCDIAELADRYETPLFIINEPSLRARARALLETRGHEKLRHEVFFSYKTNPVPGFLELLHDEGIGAEVISEYELWLALRLGVHPQKIIFNGVGKTMRAMAMAIKHAIRSINIDSFREIEAVAELARQAGRKVPVGLRILPGPGWAGQFGFSIRDSLALKAVEQIAATPELLFAGLHFHLGTQLTSLRYYREAVEAALDFAAEIKRRCYVETSFLDIGGGYGVPTVRPLSNRDKKLLARYAIPPTAPPPGACPSPDVFVQNISSYIVERCDAHGLCYPAVFFEPGRLLSSAAQILVVKITDIKERPNGMKIAVSNGGVNIAHPVLGEFREAFHVNNVSGKNRLKYMVVGPTCSIGDVLYTAKMFPEIHTGNYIAIMDAGAYFVPNANNFSFPRPAIIVVSTQGHRVTRQRESFEYMVENDSIGER